jgi:ABC-type multidrug transport system ATPase subunit
VIRVTNVTHFYEPGKPVLRGVSLAVPRGAFVAIAGASGAGKSTLLSILNGMTVPREGTVEIAGADLTRAAGRARRRIQSSGWLS